jgi:hypothetical protein
MMSEETNQSLVCRIPNAYLDGEWRFAFGENDGGAE